MKDFTKLPKWAQERIQLAEMHLRESEERLATITSKPTAEDEVVARIGAEHEIALHRHSQIRFQLPNNYWIEVGLDYHWGILLMANADMIIRPGANNTIRVSSTYSKEQGRVIA